MVKRILFGFALFVALVVAGAALANAATLRSAPRPAGFNGNRLAPATQTIQRVAQPMVNYWWFGQIYEPPVSHYDWSRWFGWLQPD